jgi:tripeptide aminopeptidase
MNNLRNRFLKYVAVNTQSVPDVEPVPSSSCQLDLARLLQDELVALGMEDVGITETGTVMATLPSNVDWEVPVVGFISHLDTSPDCSGKDVKPQIVENYQGGDIALGTSGEVLSPSVFPVMKELHGHTLITTDGTTLLGADDKAGIAEIMTAIVRLKEQNIPHGTIRVGFSPDEEVGKGAHYFDVARFNAQWAYTVDGSAEGELECENFNAASASIKIQGINVHPGTAKDVMVNALTLATRIHQSLPASETPEQTSGYEGFFHLTSMSGTVAQAEMNYILRDFSREGLAARKQKIQEVCAAVGQGLRSDCRIEVTLKDSYANMREEVAKFPHIVEIAKQAMIDLDIEPVQCPIRGGTDGSHLSFRGLPCPNLFTGGFNYHGKHEFASLDIMEKSVSVVMRIAQLTAERFKK